MTGKLHKTLLALLLVFIPPYFLVFTEEGNRVSDNALLWLFGHPDLMLNLREADSAFTESQVRQVFADIDWQCGTVDSPFGQRACNAAIGSFNDLPARHAALFFAHDQLNAIRIAYREHYHSALLAQLIGTLGQPRNATAASTDAADADTVLEWPTGKGLVVLKKTIRESDQAALLWLGAAH